MEGESLRHNRVAGNIYMRLRTAAERGPCSVYFESIKLRVNNDFYYPDVMVTCRVGKGESHVLLDPCLLVEVASPSTARSDRTDKLHAYGTIPSLQAYLVVEQAWRRVVRHWRDAGGAPRHPLSGFR